MGTGHDRREVPDVLLLDAEEHKVVLAGILDRQTVLRSKTAARPSWRSDLIVPVEREATATTKKMKNETRQNCRAPCLNLPRHFKVTRLAERLT